MANIITNDAFEERQSFSMSNQGTDCFFDMLINAASHMEMTETQSKLIYFLKEHKDINDYAPGTAGFDVCDMPWDKRVLQIDTEFMLNVIENAKNPIFWENLGFEPNENIVFPWLDQFSKMIKTL